MRALRLDPYVLDTLMPDLVGHDRRPAAFVLYLLLWRRTQGAGERSATIALEDLAELSGLSKRTVQASLRWLQSRRLVNVKRDGPTGVGRFVVLEPWKRG
ncbi:MAG: helix-turn-helix domain-containing protein [Gemmatimonadaceae bacterium]|nr:helix-turn-helix domain-containing protein [Gemmatimonadaceae bacterium]